MRRIITLTTVLGLLAAGVGCKHVGGKCDCQSYAGDAVATPPTNPYPAAPVPGTAVPSKLPPAAMPSTPTPPR